MQRFPALHKYLVQHIFHAGPGFLLEVPPGALLTNAAIPPRVPQGPRPVSPLRKGHGVKAGEVHFLRAAHALECEEIADLTPPGTIPWGHVTGASSWFRAGLEEQVWTWRG